MRVWLGLLPLALLLVAAERPPPHCTRAHADYDWCVSNDRCMWEDCGYCSPVFSESRSSSETPSPSASCSPGSPCPSVDGSASASASPSLSHAAAGLGRLSGRSVGDSSVSPSPGIAHASPSPPARLAPCKPGQVFVPIRISAWQRCTMFTSDLCAVNVNCPQRWPIYSVGSPPVEVDVVQRCIKGSLDDDHRDSDDYVVGVAVALAGVLGLVAISAFWCQSRIFKQRQLQLQRAAAARLCSEERHDAGAEADTEPEGRTGRSRSELRRGVGVGIGVGDDNRVPLLSARERRAAV